VTRRKNYFALNHFAKKLATKERKKRKAEVILHQIILLKFSHQEAQRKLFCL
jgi:hypothetical protein